MVSLVSNMTGSWRSRLCLLPPHGTIHTLYSRGEPFITKAYLLVSKSLSSLVLMTYHGVVLLLSGYQANEPKIIREYQDIVDRSVLIPVVRRHLHANLIPRLCDRFPNGALWVLNKVRLLLLC